MEIALAPLTLHRPHPLIVLETAAAAGYDLAGVQLGQTGQPISPLVRDPDFLVAARARLARGVSVLEVSNIVLDADFNSADVHALVDFAVAIGARFLQVVDWDEDRDRALEHFRTAAELAENAGLGVVIEFMPYSMTKTLEDALSLIAQSGAPNAKILLDSLHLFRSGGAVEAVAAVDPAQFAVIQLSDAPLAPPDPLALRAESTTDRLVPGSGELPLRELLDVLPPDLPVSLEVPCRAIEQQSLLDQARFVLDGSRPLLEGDRRRRAQ